MLDTAVRALFDSGSIPNVLSAALFQTPRLLPQASDWKNIIANGTEIHEVGEVKYV